KSGELNAITTDPIGNLDGVESDGADGFIVTDWIAGKVIHVNGDGNARALATFPKGAADHAYLPEKKWLLLPEMLENKIGAFDLKKALKP
ncbi:MAG: hypothetical protein GY899_04070, partial [Verrucomicrobiaceae bacterium]|nr:hypothetical protein [Verrucomicrobiaceae bacterium]